MTNFPRPALAVACLVVLGASAPVHAPARTNRDVILATTTSTQDTGLLDSLVPRFEHTCGCRVKTIAVGTGRALALAARGEADVALVHAPALEERYVAQGKFVGRRLVMTNDFVVLGPKADPAGLKHAKQVEDAFRALAEGKAPFASRADSSGTHLLELTLWKQAGIEPKGPWYLEVGQGMGATLRIASQKEAYTLSDRGTFLAQRSTLDLYVVFQRAPDLLNIESDRRPGHTRQVVHHLTGQRDVGLRYGGSRVCDHRRRLRVRRLRKPRQHLIGHQRAQLQARGVGEHEMDEGSGVRHCTCGRPQAGESLAALRGYT